ncbi:MAG: hypothetical protein ABI145_07080 [Steroidobacteraceae bacterium]
MRDWLVKKWKLALSLLMVSALAGMSVWWILLGTICRAPSTPIAATGNVIQYNCHGSVVFITQFQSRLLHWLIPALFIVAYFGQLLIRRRQRELQPL